MAVWDDSPIITPASEQVKQTNMLPDMRVSQVVSQQPKSGFAWESAPIVTPAVQRQQSAPAVPPAAALEQRPESNAPWYEGAFNNTQEKVGAGTAAIRGVGDGITFGFQDEILAGLDAAVQPLISTPENGSSADTWRQRYDENVANQRALLKTGQEQHPVTSTDLDVIKQNLDGQVERLLNSGARSEARDIVGIRNDLLSVMDASAPTYAQARAVFAGHSRYLDGVDHGAMIMKPNISPERWASDIARLNPSEQEAVRIGAISSIIGKIGNDAAAMPDITKYLRSPNGRAKIAAILPDDAARQRWENSLNHEIEVSRLSGRALGNSATARRQAEIDEANGVMSDLVAIGFSASSGTGLMHTLLRSLPRAAGARINERSQRVLANALTSKDGLDALTGVLPRAVVGRNVPAVASIAAGQDGSTDAARRASQRQNEIQAATAGYYQTQGAANQALRQARIRNEYEAFKVPGTGAWSIRAKEQSAPSI